MENVIVMRATFRTASYERFRGGSPGYELQRVPHPQPDPPPDWIGILLVVAYPFRLVIQKWRQPKQYLSYAEDIHSLRNTMPAKAFCDEFRAAHAARLERLEIQPYPINDVRVLESAVFELSNAGEYEDD
jgi:hypothetical protein